MTTIHFSSPRLSKTVTLQAPGRAGTTLLAVARQYGVPILFNCEAGGCGACLVAVENLSNPTNDGVRLSESEVFFLMATGRLPSEGPDAKSQEPGIGADAPRRLRLACQYVLGGDDLRVHFPYGLESP